MYTSIAGLIVLSLVQGVFTIEDDGKSLQIFEGDTPVLTYRYQPGDLPDGVDEHYRRASYIHPLFGLDGEIMTQDFPSDHFHHRGLFWAWPDSTLGDKRVNVWLLDGIRSVHTKWVEQQVKDKHAVIDVVNHWVYDDDPENPVVKEEVRIEVHAATEQSRSIDFELTFTNTADDVLVLRGSGTDDKGYGGFCLRPNATRKPLHFSSALGSRNAGEDVTSEVFSTPWIDVSYAVKEDTEIVSGVAMFEHPKNDGYPHPRWIIRHYGFLGQSWPHIQGHVLQPNDSVTLRYRLFIHRGDADTADVAAAFSSYTQSIK
ncbi:MAG: PmoA family protein [Candidatus Hydrogenedentes bacterium]|nr:PmoA family protein [Candidatus Hydrogenedentota bacterium]